MKKIITGLLCLALLFNVISCKPKPTTTSSTPISTTLSTTSESSSASSDDEYLDSGSSQEGTSSNAASTANSSKSVSNTKFDPGAGIGVSIDYSKVTVPNYNTGTNKKIKVVIPWDSKSQWVTDWTKAYKSLYSGDVSYTIVDSLTMNQKLAAMKASGNPADAAYVEASRNWPMVLKADLAQDAGKIMDLNAPLWQRNKNSQALVKYNGKNSFIVTECTASNGIAYNKKVMKDAGLTEPLTQYYNGKWTWDTFLDYAKQLTQDIDSDGIVDMWGAQSAYWDGLLLTSGKDYISVNESGYTLNLNNPNLQRAVSFLQSLGPAKNNVTTKLDFNDELSRMRQGKIGMLIIGAPHIYLPDMIENKNLGYAPMPRDPKADKPYVPSYIKGFIILKGAANPNAAADYIAAVEIATVPQLSERLLTKDAQSVDTASMKAFKKVLNDQFEHQRLNAYPVIQYFDRFQPELYYWSLWGNVLYDSKPWSSVVQEMTPKINAAIDKIK
jgi:ABC-type glycerol-3-phosphate transport system substrate-binding protein